MCYLSRPRESTGFLLKQLLANPSIPRETIYFLVRTTICQASNTCAILQYQDNRQIFLTKQLSANRSIARETTCFLLKQLPAKPSFSATINHMCYPSTPRESTGFLLNQPHVNPRMPRASTDFFLSKQLLANLSI